MREFTQTKNPVLFVVTHDRITLYGEPKRHTASDVCAAKRWVKQKYPEYPFNKIVSATNDQKMLEFIKLVYRHELTKGLRWFQIPTMTIKKFIPLYKKGITVEAYIKKYVIPKVTETEAEYLKKYGESIY